MASTDASFLPQDFFVSEEVENARWLASLISSLRDQADHAGQPEVAKALEDALAAALVIANRTAEH